MEELSRTTPQSLEGANRASDEEELARRRNEMMREDPEVQALVQALAMVKGDREREPIAQQKLDAKLREKGL